jgi:hypothetical protein
VFSWKVTMLHDLLGSEATRAEAVELIRSLIDQVTFRPTARDGVEIGLDGDLARMVHLAQQSPENSENSPIAGAVHEEFACSVKVVEGEQLATNILCVPARRDSQEAVVRPGPKPVLASCNGPASKIADGW